MLTLAQHSLDQQLKYCCWRNVGTTTTRQRWVFWLSFLVCLFVVVFFWGGGGLISWPMMTQHMHANTPVYSYDGMTSLSRCSSVSEARKAFVYGWCMRCIVKSYLSHLLNEYSSFIVLNYEYVYKMTFLCENLSYNLSLSCRFYSKGLHFTNGITILSTFSF